MDYGEIKTCSNELYYLILISHYNEILGVFDSQMKPSVVFINFRAQSNVSSNNNVPILIWIPLVHSFLDHFSHVSETLSWLIDVSDQSSGITFHVLGEVFLNFFIQLIAAHRANSDDDKEKRDFRFGPNVNHCCRYLTNGLPM